MKRGLVLRLVERLYVWLVAREEARFRRERPDWWARVQAAYKLDRPT